MAALACYGLRTVAWSRDPDIDGGRRAAHAQRSRRLPDGFLRSANRPFRPYQPVRQSAHQPTAESQPILNGIR